MSCTELLVLGVAGLPAGHKPSRDLEKPLSSPLRGSGFHHHLLQTHFVVPPQFHSSVLVPVPPSCCTAGRWNVFAPESLGLSRAQSQGLIRDPWLGSNLEHSPGSGTDQ